MYSHRTTAPAAGKKSQNLNPVGMADQGNMSNYFVEAHTLINTMVAISKNKAIMDFSRAPPASTLMPLSFEMRAAVLSHSLKSLACIILYPLVCGLAFFPYSGGLLRREAVQGPRCVKVVQHHH